MDISRPTPAGKNSGSHPCLSSLPPEFEALNPLDMRLAASGMPGKSRS
jgi:hypothetical protein